MDKGCIRNMCYVWNYVVIFIKWHIRKYEWKLLLEDTSSVFKVLPKHIHTFQMLKQIGSSLPIEFIQKILERDSPLRKLRVSPHQLVWKATLGVYHAVLALKNVPLLQEAYNYILADIQVVLSHFCKRNAIIVVSFSFSLVFWR